MNDILTNRIDMIGVCINTADKTANSAVWNQLPHLDFVTDIAWVKQEYTDISAKAAIANAATTGPAEAKDLAETALENAAFTMARALCVHFKRTGNWTDRAKVDFTKSGLIRMRDQQLKTTTELIRDLANVARDESGAGGRGITAARILTLNGAIAAYAGVISAPRGQILTRATLKRELEVRVAAVIERLRDMDDIVLQYDETEAGRSFIAQWQTARIVIELGHGPTPTPTPTPTPRV